MSTTAWRGGHCWQVQRRLRLLCVAAGAWPAQLGHQQCVILVRVGAEGEQVGDVLARDVTEVLLQAHHHSGSKVVTDIPRESPALQHSLHDCCCWHVPASVARKIIPAVADTLLAVF
jgi:hypothetical protein